MASLGRSGVWASLRLRVQNPVSSSVPHFLVGWSPKKMKHSIIIKLKSALRRHGGGGRRLDRDCLAMHVQQV